jgi:hypothetical protein
MMDELNFVNGKYEDSILKLAITSDKTSRIKFLEFPIEIIHDIEDIAKDGVNESFLKSTEMMG